MDVVPPGDLNMWETDPYKIEVKEGKIYGRGTEDNQQSLVASIFALKAFIDEGLVPEYDTGLVFVADEETGSQFGLGHVLKEYKNFRHEDYILVPDSEIVMVP
jgi:succinyl-diaminopimelate desuccinylase